MDHAAAGPSGAAAAPAADVGMREGNGSDAEGGVFGVAVRGVRGFVTDRSYLLDFPCGNSVEQSGRVRQDVDGMELCCRCRADASAPWLKVLRLCYSWRPAGRTLFGLPYSMLLGYGDGRAAWHVLWGGSSGCQGCGHLRAGALPCCRNGVFLLVCASSWQHSCCPKLCHTIPVTLVRAFTLLPSLLRFVQAARRWTTQRRTSAVRRRRLPLVWTCVRGMAPTPKVGCSVWPCVGCEGT